MGFLNSGTMLTRSADFRRTINVFKGSALQVLCLVWTFVSETGMVLGKLVWLILGCSCCLCCVTSRECHACRWLCRRFCRPLVSTPKPIPSQGFAYAASVQLVCQNAAFKCLFPRKGTAEFGQPVPSASLEWCFWSEAGNICNSSWQVGKNMHLGGVRILPLYFL